MKGLIRHTRKFGGYALLIASVSGCAQHEKPNVVTPNNSTLTLSSYYVPEKGQSPTDLTLRVVTKEYVSGVGVGYALGMALLGSYSVAATQKENMRGVNVSTLEQPTYSYFIPKMKTQVANWMQANSAGYAYKNDLFVYPVTWLLVYSNLTKADGLYELRYRIDMHKRPEDGNMFSAWNMYSCTPTPKVAKYEDWTRNDYALVKSTTQEYMDSCLKQTQDQLPNLLKK
jgi:hypothetical protein